METCRAHLNPVCSNKTIFSFLFLQPPPMHYCWNKACMTERPNYFPLRATNKNCCMLNMACKQAVRSPFPHCTCTNTRSLARSIVGQSLVLSNAPRMHQRQKLYECAEPSRGRRDVTIEHCSRENRLVRVNKSGADERCHCTITFALLARQFLNAERRRFF